MSARAGCFAFFVLFVLLLVLAARPLLEAYAGWFEVEDREVRSDVAVILDGGKGERLWKGIDLWNRGLCGHILITGESDPILPVYAGGPGITQAEAKREIAVRKGVPSGAIEVILGPTSTYEEAEAVKSWCASQGNVRTLMVVTSPFHTRRARAVFRHVFRGSPVTIRVTHAPWNVSSYSPKRWWTREGDLIAIFDETAKTVFYIARYHVSPI